MDLHLESEEEHALPLFLRYFSTDEIDAVGDAHFAKNADKLNVMIPWAATALPTEAATEMLADMPPAGAGELLEVEPRVPAAVRAAAGHERSRGGRVGETSHEIAGVFRV